MAEFIHWCDSVLEELELNRDKVINDIEDVGAILFEIGFATRNSPEVAAQTLRILHLLPVDFGPLRHTKIRTFLEDKGAEETEFIMGELKKLTYAK